MVPPPKGPSVPSETTRRAVIGAVLAGGVGGLALSDTARDFIDGFAPLSGRVWDTSDRSLPETVANPYGEAELYRDEYGIPHVESDDEEAAYYAIGYVQGFDRIFGMDLQRRMLKGQLAEVVGDVMGIADDDEFHRQMDFESAARATYEAHEGTGSPVEPLGEAYAEGVNDSIDSHPLPIEFALLDYEPEEWTLTDSLLMEKNISWNLTGGFGELSRERRHAALGAELMEELDPLFIDHDYPILRDDLEDPEGVDVDPDAEYENPTLGVTVDDAIADFLLEHEPPEYFGSNSWAVGSDLAAGDAPIVANDPHLLLMAPALWYEQHVSVPDYSVRGFTFPGVPFVIIGANENGAWGFTNAGADVTDLHRYEFNDEGEYRYGDEWLEPETPEDADTTIRVDGADNREVSVERTVHGPLIERDGEQIAVAWTGFTATRTVEAIYEFNRSEGLADIQEATEKFDLPTQCLLYADSESAYFALTGKIPIRRTPDGEVVDGVRVFDGSAPEAEWPGFEPFGETDWEEWAGEGFLDFETQQPQHVLADDEAIGTANQRIADHPDHYIGYSYMSPERGKRIYDVLDEAKDAGEPMDVSFHEDLITDTRDERAVLVVDDIVDAVEDQDVDGDVESAADTLEAWDYRMDRDSEGALLFGRWIVHFPELIAEDALADADVDFTPNDWVALSIDEDSVAFPDRSRDELLVAALEAAVEDIDEEGWETYGDWNSTRNVTHPFGDEVPFLNYDDLPADGSHGTVNNFRADQPGEDFAAGASLRLIDEPGGRSTAILPGGNSGDYFSDHYDDQLEMFLDGEFRSFDREVEGELVTTFEGDGQ